MGAIKRVPASIRKDGLLIGEKIVEYLENPIRIDLEVNENRLIIRKNDATGRFSCKATFANGAFIKGAVKLLKDFPAQKLEEKQIVYNDNERTACLYLMTSEK